MIGLCFHFVFEDAREFGGDLLAVDVEKRTGQIGKRGGTERVAVAVETVASREVGAFVSGQGVQDDGLAVVVVGIECLELVEQESGGEVERAFIDGNAGVAGLDQGPECAGSRELAGDIAVPAAVRGLACHQRGDERAGAFGELTSVVIFGLALLGIGKRGSCG